MIYVVGCGTTCLKPRESEMRAIAQEIVTDNQ